MARKIILKKKVNTEVVSFFPQTSADNVMYDEDTTVKEVIDAVILELRWLEKVLSINSLYMVDDDGVTLLNDGNGNNLIAVASLIANTDSNDNNEDWEPESSGNG